MMAVGLILAYYFLNSPVTTKASTLFSTTCALGMMISMLQSLGIIGTMTVPWILTFGSGCGCEVDWPVNLGSIFNFVQVFIDKKIPGETRPISLAQIAWRIGSKWLVWALRDWTDTWLDDSVLGGVPASSPSDMHTFVEWANTPDSIYVSQDLAKCFDSINYDALKHVMIKLKMPSAALNLILNFYCAQRRFLTYRGASTGTWLWPERGILQGCPLSPLIAASFMRLWSQTVRTSGLRAHSFVDDRLIIANQTMIAQLQQAKRQGDVFDTACGFECRPSKCAIAARPTTAACALADAFQYKLSDELDLLGLVHKIGQPGAARLAKPILNKIEARAQCIQVLPVPTRERSRLIRQLVLPCLHWCAGHIQIQHAVLRKLRRIIFRAIQGQALHDLPFVVGFSVLGWQLDPLTSAKHAILDTIIRFHLRRPRWQDHVPVALALAKWREALPNARDLLNELEWWTDDSCDSIYRLDAHQQLRTFCIGIDHPSIIHAWLDEAVRIEELHKCGRIKQSLHRTETDNLAQGMTLPGPPARTQCLFNGHRQLWSGARDHVDHHTAFATGCSVWYAFRGQRPHGDDPQAQCKCGLTLPSRPHLVWTCPAFASCKLGLEVPQHRAEERLFAKCISAMPAAPPVPEYASVIDECVRSLNQHVPEESYLCIATDGSSSHDIAAFAIHFPTLNQQISSGIPGEDQSPFRAELEALHLSLQAIERIDWRKRKRVPHIVIISDCQAALDIVAGHYGSCRLLAAQIHETRRRVEAKVSIELVWVPSHGKLSPKFIGHPAFTMHFLRECNSKADQLANLCMRRRLHESARHHWHLQVAADQLWEARVLKDVSSIARTYL